MSDNERNKIIEEVAEFIIGNECYSHFCEDYDSYYNEKIATIVLTMRKNLETKSNE